MRRATQILRKPVVLGASGEYVGRVKNLIVDERQGTCLGLVLRRAGLFGRTRVLPFRDVVAIGTEFLVARDRESLVRLRDLPEITDSTRVTPLTGKPLVSGEGQRLGRIVDLRIDERSGRIDGYELSPGGVTGLFARRQYLPASGPLVAGDDVVLAPADAAAWVQPAARDETREPLPSARG